MKYLLLILLISGKDTLAQNSKTGNYYKYIYKGEECILNSALDSSSYYFSLAFKYVEFPFARNIYNAAVVDAKLSKNEKVYNYLVYLLKLGASYHQLFSDTSFKKFFLSDYGKKLIAFSEQIKPTYNKYYRAQIEKLVKDDQYFRIKPNANSTYIDTIKAIDRQNIATFLSLNNKYGFPSEHEIGIDSNIFTLPLYALIILHQSNGRLQQHNFDELLTKNILDGKIENKIGAYLLNRLHGTTISAYEVIKFQFVKVKDTTMSASDPNNTTVIKETEWGYFPINEKEVNKVNIARSQIYLDGYYESIKKILFGLIHKEYRMFSTGALTKQNYTSLTRFNSDKEKLVF